MRINAPLGLCLVATLAAGGAIGAQSPELPPALVQLIETERAFAARAREGGWKQAFLEYFAATAIAFAKGQVVLARDQIGAAPDPPPGYQLLWEPRYGDISSSGELGYLMGPSRSIAPGRGTLPRHANAFSIWKRQRDGTFKVIIHIGTDTPDAPPYPPGFTRAPAANRFTGDYDDSTPPLAVADGILNSGLRASQARAYRGRLTDDARLLRPNQLPIVGERDIARWLATQPALAASDTRYSEAARSGDLGYTWGTYRSRRRASTAPRDGFYVRVWVRERSGQWKVAVDAVAPQ